MMSDVLSEMEFGKGAIRTVGKVIMGRYNDFEGKPTVLVLGRVFTGEEVVKPLTKEQKKATEGWILQDEDEMWEGEIVFIPHRKYKCNKEQGWKSLEAGQKLASAWGSPENWKFKIFDKQA